MDHPSGEEIEAKEEGEVDHDHGHDNGNHGGSKRGGRGDSKPVEEA